MADDPRQPVAIRVSRPYADENEFLEHELEMITRTSVVLVGAQSRPQGVILRFEVALTNGTALIRGEGRVVAFKPRALGELPGLTLRFTRLDARSKALIDRAAGLREARARAALQEALSDSVLPEAPSAPPPPVDLGASSLGGMSRPAFSVVSTIPSLGPQAARAATPPAPEATTPPVLPELPLAHAAASASPAPAEASPARAPNRARPATDIAHPSAEEREPLLAKLRRRASALSPDQVQGILTKRTR